MILPLVFRHAAQEEFNNAAAWYETQRSALGADFVREVLKVLDTVASQPFRYAAVYRDVREALVSRFPYCVYYRVKPDRVVVIAVFHCSRDPSVWQSRA